jgi:phosphatidylserine decarboxylase
MYTTLLFKESPVQSLIIILFCILSVLYKSYKVLYLFIFLFLFLIIFYRYKPHSERYANNVIISPAEGIISYLEQKDDKIIVSIYLNLLNNHTQIYPVNGVVVNRIYDNSGKFDLVNNRTKSRFNEKKIHTIEMENKKTIVLTQIAGFFARRISSSKTVPQKVMAGEYLGIIKFGSRVDLEFEGDISKIMIKDDQKINIGDIIYKY